MAPPSSDSETVSQAVVAPDSRGGALFLRAWLRAPLSIASLVPSSRATGEAFVQLLDSAGEGDILELGSGTGAISQTLLAAGIPEHRLVMVEREPELADHLRHRFPAVRTFEGDVADLGTLLDRHGVGRLSAVVSSLPIVWFPLQVQAAVLSACFDRLDPVGEFLQMTNQPASPLPLRKLRIKGERAATIWRNFPPSFIWRYWRE